MGTFISKCKLMQTQIRYPIDEEFIKLMKTDEKTMQEYIRLICNKTLISTIVIFINNYPNDIIMDILPYLQSLHIDLNAIPPLYISEYDISSLNLDKLKKNAEQSKRAINTLLDDSKN